MHIGPLQATFRPVGCSTIFGMAGWDHFIDAVFSFVSFQGMLISFMSSA
jgi:hypothetical protein